MSNSEHIRTLILARLGESEMRFLSLVVGVRKDLFGRPPVKGDLPQMVKTALRGMLLSNTIVEADGTYGLSPHSKASQ